SGSASAAAIAARRPAAPPPTTMSKEVRSTKCPEPRWQIKRLARTVREASRAEANRNSERGARRIARRGEQDPRNDDDGNPAESPHRARRNQPARAPDAR